MQRKISLAGLSLMLLTLTLLAVMLPSASAQRGGRPTPSGNVQPTIQAVSTQLSQNSAGAQATLQAASTQLIQAADNVQATLSAVVQGTTIIISQDNQSATISYTFPEATINAVVNASLAAAGYPNATADLIAGGIVITVPNITYGQWTGTLVATYAVSAQNGGLVVTVTSITIAGHSIPTSAFDTLTQSLTDALNSIIEATSETAISYSLDALVITDTQMTVTMTFTYTGELPQPDMTPTFIHKHG